MLDSLVHLLGQVPGRAFPDERRVPQLARQHGRCCSRRVVQVLALIELFRARTRVELQKFMNLRIGRFLQWYWNMQAHSGLPGVAITCWGGQWVRLIMKAAFQLSCPYFVSDFMAFFVRYTLADIHQCLLKLHQQHVAAEEYPQQAMRWEIGVENHWWKPRSLSREKYKDAKHHGVSDIQPAVVASAPISSV